MAAPPLIFVALSVVSSLQRYSDFSVPEVLVATNHFKMVLPTFSETCPPFDVSFYRICRMHGAVHVVHQLLVDPWQHLISP